MGEGWGMGGEVWEEALLRKEGKGRGRDVAETPSPAGGRRTSK